MRVVTICGSLRARSSNQAVLRAYARLGSPDMTFAHYDHVGSLPPFNPDLDREDEPLPGEVARLRATVGTADALALSTPEYAHGLPGAFKNLLDWLVGDPAFGGKPVVILHVARGSTWALDSLREILRTMSAHLVEPASIALPLGSNQLDEAAILARDDLRSQLRQSLEALKHAFAARPAA